MSAVTSRRGALGAILAAPLATVPARAAVAKPAGSASPELLRLIRKHDRINALFCEEAEDGPLYGTMLAASVARTRVAAFPSTGLPDILAKAACLARLWPLSDLEEEVRGDIDGGWVHIDGMGEALLAELMRYGEGTLCA